MSFTQILRSGHEFSSDEVLLEFRFKLLNSIMMVIVIASFTFGSLHFLKINIISDFHAYANYIFSLSSIIFLTWLRYDKESYSVIVVAMILSALITFTSALITVPQDELRIMWFYVTIVTAFFAGGIIYGYATAIATILIILISNAMFPLNLSTLAITTSISGIIILTLIVSIYAKKVIDIEESLSMLNKLLTLKVEDGISELRHKDELMLQQARLAQMGEMIAMIAHQWRQPLSSIGAISTNLKLSLILGEEISNETLSSELQSIDERIELLSKTIDDFRNFYKTDNKKDYFDVNSMINKTIEVLKPALKNANVTLKTHAGLLEKISTYESEIIQVLMNIIKNSIDAHKEKDSQLPREIDVYSVLKNNKILIEVLDNAGGIKENILSNIFDPYFSTKTSKNGTGLGLYMSRIIISEHCMGSLEVENIKDGVKFTISLPLN